LKQAILILTVFFLAESCSSIAQTTLKLNDDNSIFAGEKQMKHDLRLATNVNGEDAFLWFFYVLFVLDPDVMVENKKAYFGLTKEISAGYYPLGRIAFEYTYMFERTNKSLFRLSYNYDFELGDYTYLISMASVGAGYFSDTKENGWFPQASIGLALPIRWDFLAGVYIYIKGRYTFVSGSGNHNNADFSLGMNWLIVY